MTCCQLDLPAFTTALWAWSSSQFSHNTGFILFILQWRFNRWWKQLSKLSKENSYPCSSDVFVVFPPYDMTKIDRCKSLRVACSECFTPRSYMFLYILYLNCCFYCVSPSSLLIYSKIPLGIKFVFKGNCFVLTCLLAFVQHFSFS